jgi:hypothetical protein
MSKRMKVTPELIKRLVAEEKAKLANAESLQETLETGVTEPEKVKAEEVEADEMADTLAKDVDFVKALKIEEARLVKRLNTLREAKAAAIGRISRRIS